MNAIVYEKGKDTIKHFVENCIKKGKRLVGTNSSVHINPRIFDVIWTDDVTNPITNTEGEIIGWDRTVASIVPSADSAEIKSPTHNELKEAIKLRKLVDTMTYQGLDNYIENNVVDLPSAKVFIKTLAKVTLALCKLIDSK